MAQKSVFDFNSLSAQIPPGGALVPQSPQYEFVPIQNERLSEENPSPSDESLEIPELTRSGSEESQSDAELPPIVVRDVARVETNEKKKADQWTRQIQGMCHAVEELKTSKKKDHGEKQDYGFKPPASLGGAQDQINSLDSAWSEFQKHVRKLEKVMIGVQQSHEKLLLTKNKARRAQAYKDVYDQKAKEKAFVVQQKQDFERNLQKNLKAMRKASIKK